jgi:hypothetical protein
MGIYCCRQSYYCYSCCIPIVIPVTVPIIFPIIIVVLPVIVIPFRIVVLLRGFSIVEEQLQFNSAAYRPEVEIET